MNKRLKLFLIAFILSLPFWWGINVLAENLEDFWFCQKLVKDPQIFSAEASASCFSGFLIADNSVQIPVFEEVKIVADNLEEDTKAAILVKVDREGKEKIIFEKNSQKILPIASLTKLMTALVVFDLDETYDISQIIKISKEAANQEGAAEYEGLKEGEEFSVETLLNIMLIESSNDAAYAITELIGQEAFIDLMNLQAEKLGLRNTHFFNSTGLDLDGRQIRNVSTGRDLVELSKYIFKKYPQVFEITRKNSYRVLNPDGSLRHFISKNTNELLEEFPQIIGGKTGLTLSSGGCLLLVLEGSEGSYFITAVLGSRDRFEETKKLIDLTKDF